MPAHIHMLFKIPPKISVSGFMGYLKGKSALMIFERHANLLVAPDLQRRQRLTARGGFHVHVFRRHAVVGRRADGKFCPVAAGPDEPAAQKRRRGGVRRGVLPFRQPHVRAGRACTGDAVHD